MDTYIVLKPIWHRGNKKSYGPGAEITLYHLTDEEIRKVISLGIVKKVVRALVRKSPTSKPVGTSKKSAPVKKPNNIEGEEK